MAAEDRRRQKSRRDIWQLHIPLVVALAVCTAATVVEFSRATDGVPRAWAYTFQWPLFGLFAIWMWVRYRREDQSSDRPDAAVVTRVQRRNPFAGMVDHWRSNVADAQRSVDVAPDDPDLIAWQEHVQQRRRTQAETSSSGLE